MLVFEALGAQLSYFRADRAMAIDMSVVNGPINNIASPTLFHQAAAKSYVDNRFFAYIYTYEANECLISSRVRTQVRLRTIDQRMLPLHSLEHVAIRRH